MTLSFLRRSRKNSSKVQNIIRKGSIGFNGIDNALREDEGLHHNNSSMDSFLGGNMSYLHYIQSKAQGDEEELERRTLQALTSPYLRAVVVEDLGPFENIDHDALDEAAGGSTSVKDHLIMALWFAIHLEKLKIVRYFEAKLKQIVPPEVSEIVWDFLHDKQVRLKDVAKQCPRFNSDALSIAVRSFEQYLAELILTTCNLNLSLKMVRDMIHKGYLSLIKVIMREEREVDKSWEVEEVPIESPHDSDGGDDSPPASIFGEKMLSRVGTGRTDESSGTKRSRTGSSLMPSLRTSSSSVIGARSDYIAINPDESRLTFEEVFSCVITSHLEIVETINEIMTWTDLIRREENILISLLKNKLDTIAAYHATQFLDLINPQCIHCAISNGNNKFLQLCCYHDYINNETILNSSVNNQIVELLKSGNTFFLGANLLNKYQNLNWKKPVIRDIITVVSTLIKAKGEYNELFLCHNPIFAFVLIWEFLGSMGDHFRGLLPAILQLQKNIIRLSNIIQDKIKITDQLRDIFLEKDFSGRTLMHVVCKHHQLASLLVNDKVEDILEDLWHGESAQCDGKYENFSHMNFLMNFKTVFNINNNTHRRTAMFDELFHYKPDLEKNYSLQFHFRINSLRSIFLIEFLSALLVVILFLNLVFFYVTYIRNIDWDKAGTTLHNKYKNDWELLTQIITAINISVVLYVGYYIFYAIKTKTHINIDKWTRGDLVSSLVIFLCMNTLGTEQDEGYVIGGVISTQKLALAMIIIMSWFRMYSFCLVSERISPFLFTLQNMIGSVLYFMVILVSFMLTSSCIFTALFSLVDHKTYGGLWKSLKTSTKTMFGEFEFQEANTNSTETANSTAVVNNVAGRLLDGETFWNDYRFSI
eukprot:CAMPEP_0114991676 /NCGR_PEP_ID=MMETSP0216-20121206/11508_1 /TAXON_ID=223996 /ORGANISM="Protocruzia adherens, Strain Boccale" /LENGTH=873 /DNA_ID=CAMNT_0002355037 /DNA_START=113 /DNA_END=2731 /DNA_ORIENTATION=+